MLSVKDILSRLGGASAVAAELGLFRNVPSKWVQRGVPERYAAYLAQRLGVDQALIPTPSHLRQGSVLRALPPSSPSGVFAMTAFVPELYLPSDQAGPARTRAGLLPSWDLTARQLCDLELLLNGAFAPLRGFMAQGDYAAVLETLRLESGALWPMPITLDVSEAFAEQITLGDEIVLRDSEAVVIAIMTVQDKWTPDKAREARLVFGADDPAHPGVAYLHTQAGTVYLGGPVKGVDRPSHYDFRALRHTPNELRTLFDKWGWRRIVAFQTRNPLHRAHQELTLRAARSTNANLLIHPVVGMTRPGDVDHFTRVRCYQAILGSYPEQTTTMSLLHLAMRMGGPREALWHALIRKNYGATHMIIGRDHAGPGKNSAGQDFYDPYAAQVLVQQHHEEIGLEMVPFKMMVYVQDRAQYVPVDEVKKTETQLNISGTEVRRRLRQDLDIPTWFSPPEVIAELKKSFPPLEERGFTVFFTGLSGSGKSTVANALLIKLMELGGRPVTLLDGDVVRKNLSSELTFSKEHRDLNIQRIGYVASEITKNRGIAICAPIAPYAVTRAAVREVVEAYGLFVEVHVATSIKVCEARDRKGLYAAARAGKIKGFTGIDDPYEPPQAPEVRLETEGRTPDDCAMEVMLKLQELGLVR